MTAVGFVVFAFAFFLAFMERHGGLKLSRSLQEALGLVLIGAYMAMTYGIASFLWEHLP